MDEDNITYRKRRMSTSLTDINSSSLFDTTMLSLPNTSLPNNSETENLLNERINRLTAELQSANGEIENLLSENTRLKSDLEKSNKVIELYKKIGIYDSNKCPTPQSGRKNSNKFRHTLSNVSTPIKSTPTIKTSSGISCGSLKEKVFTSVNTCPVTAHNSNRSPTTSINRESLNSIQNRPIPNNNLPNALLGKQIGLKKKVIIVADQQGKGLQKVLQNLIGPEYAVFCVFKPYAQMSEVLTSLTGELYENLTDSDFVIVLGGVNDTSPYKLQTSLHNFIETHRGTNIFICEVPFNKSLSEYKLNYLLRFVSGKFDNVTYVDMNYIAFRPYKHNRAEYKCRHLLREILKVNYKIKFDKYNADLERIKPHNIRPEMHDKGSQTEAYNDVVSHNDNVVATNVALTGRTTPPRFFRV